VVEESTPTEAGTEGRSRASSTRSKSPEQTEPPKPIRDGLDDALLGDDPIPGLDVTVDQMLQGFFEKLAKITQ